VRHATNSTHKRTPSNEYTPTQTPLHKSLDLELDFELDTTPDSKACHDSLTGDPGVSLRIVGKVGPSISSPAAREALAEALLAAAANTADSDSETLAILIRLVESTLAAGMPEYNDQSQSLSSWRTDEQLIHEPAMAALLQVRCFRCLPLYLAHSFLIFLLAVYSLVPVSPLSWPANSEATYYILSFTFLAVDHRPYL